MRARVMCGILLAGTLTVGPSMRLGLVLATVAFFGLASTPAIPATLIDDAKEYVEDKQPRFQPYEPNYMLIQQYTEGDDSALEGHYSFKYLFTKPDCTDDNRRAGETFQACANRFLSRSEWYFKFTGEFDFYMLTRESGPVINRQSNPGLHRRQYFHKKDVLRVFSVKYFDLGLQHFSNGQAADADEGCASGTCLTQQVFDRNPDDPFFDSISRGVNFISAEASLRFGKNRGNKTATSGRCDGSPHCYDLWLRLNSYFSDDNPVTWGPDVNIHRVAGFELLRVILSHRRLLLEKGSKETGFSELEGVVKWKVGGEFFDGDSIEIGFYFPWQHKSGVRLPFYLQVHDGPLNNLSDYTRSRTAVGFGLRFY